MPLLADENWSRTRSEELLAIIRDPAADQDRTAAAIVETLELPSGWWCDQNEPLLKFTRAYALNRAKKSLPRDLSPDSIDWEGVADEVVVNLWKRGTRITRFPRAWYLKSIENLIRKEIRSGWRHLVTDELDERIEAPPAHDADLLHGVQETSTAWSQAEIEEAIRRLPPSLRTTAELVVIHRVESREQIARSLNVNRTLLRQRLQRIAVQFVRPVPARVEAKSARRKSIL
jgi:DNA-directed RNA polymerase specialized sigma24 family protein